jgi:uncharacterized repeat protein (TIGR03806 family)
LRWLVPFLTVCSLALVACADALSVDILDAAVMDVAQPTPDSADTRDATVEVAQPVPDAGGLVDAAGPDGSSCVPTLIGATLGDLQDAAPSAPAAEFGIDVRPVQTTCKPLQKPTGLPGDPFPATLLATGCFTPADLRVPVAGVIPFTVNSPLWSDGAEKHRFMVIPDGGKIRVGSDGDFDFPIGTMLLKTFALAGKMLETRFMVHHDDGEWVGYTYVWDESGSNSATLQGEDSARRFIGDLQWIFPGRAACLSCHTKAAGRSLGPEVGQLNGDFTYPGNRRANQLRTLEHLGLFEKPIGDVSKLAVMPTPGLAATGTLEQRARAYLHSNCSHCHRPEGLVGLGDLPTFDLRYTVPLLQTGIFNREPIRGALGIPGARILRPGSSAQSVIAFRMGTTVPNWRMPAIGSYELDPLGIKVVNAWIDAFAPCNE